MSFVAYVIYSQKWDKYYIGHTNNVERRLIEHNSEKAKYTKQYQPWQIVYTESFHTRAAAKQLEGYLKSLKNKERLKNYIQGWRSSKSLK